MTTNQKTTKTPASEALPEPRKPGCLDLADLRDWESMKARVRANSSLEELPVRRGRQLSMQVLRTGSAKRPQIRELTSSEGGRVGGTRRG